MKGEVAMPARKALYYRSDGEDVICLLCPQSCRIKEEQLGACGARKVEKGELLTLNYARCCSIAMDPIEKKPLYHFYPGWKILSIGTFGCNLHCTFCQNWTLARGESASRSEEITPYMLLDILKDSLPEEKLGVAFTYNEPGVWYEFVLETSRFLAGEGLKNVLVTNGYLSPKPLKELLPSIDAMNIDVKAFSDSFYRRYCRGKGLREVLRTVEQALGRCHIELTYLIISTLNDSPGEIGKFVDWVASLDREIPVHFSRYFPNYLLDIPPTPLATMQKAWTLASEKLSYVYLGNVGDQQRSTTYCPSCGKPLISRTGYQIHNTGLHGKSCSECGYTIRLEGHIYGKRV